MAPPSTAMTSGSVFFFIFSFSAAHFAVIRKEERKVTSDRSVPTVGLA